MGILYFCAQLYKEALDIVLSLVGELHVMAIRLYFNTAINLEAQEDFGKAFDYFLKAYQVCEELYGESHPRTQRPLDSLYEDRYQDIANERGIKLPNHPTVPRKMIEKKSAVNQD